ncbi:MAG: hypothetical protein JWP22_684, partial [Ramlibacter sp.]|nr:hypothetical protein [Ramlibacter sp.]
CRNVVMAGEENRARQEQLGWRKQYP